jgi:hypothetical protein
MEDGFKVSEEVFGIFVLHHAIEGFDIIIFIAGCS